MPPAVVASLQTGELAMENHQAGAGLLDGSLLNLPGAQKASKAVSPAMRMHSVLIRPGGCQQERCCVPWAWAAARTVCLVCFKPTLFKLKGF